MSAGTAIDWAHPIYRQLAWWWEFYRISWVGGDDYLTPTIRSSPVERSTSLDLAHTIDVPSRHRSMLWSFSAEENEDFEDRLKRARYDNFCAPLVRARLGHVMSGEIERAAPGLDEYLADVDGSGADRDTWMRYGGTLAQVFGHVFAATEIPATVEQPRNAAEARAMGQRVYSTFFSPLDVPSWAVDDRGELVWIVLRYQPSATGEPFGQQRNVAQRYRVWYRDRWEDWEAKSDDEAARPEPTGLAGPNPIGRVPVDVLYYSRDVSQFPHPVGWSGIAGIADDNREHFNLLSLLGQQLYEQTFASLAVPAESPEQLKDLVRSVKRVMGFAKDGGPPAFVSPPEGPTRVLMDNIDKLEQRMRAMSNLSRGVSEQSVAARSGDALAIEAADKFADLRQFRAEMQAFEVRNLRTAAEWANVDPASITVSYPDPEGDVESETTSTADGTQERPRVVPAPPRAA